MCNRYALTKKQERIITREFGSLELYFMERFNIAPTQSASVLLVEDGRIVTREMRWGFAVRWTRAPLLNIQLESSKKPAFRETFETHRILIPASGFYEWTDYGGRRQPIRFQFEDERLFCFAGLYSANDSGKNFAIITVPANDFVRKVHTRMPFIVQAGDYDAWLDPQSDSYKRVVPASEPLKGCWINPEMNNARNDTEESARPLLARIKSAPPGFSLPDGLPKDAIVKILEFDRDTFEIEYKGKTFKVPSPALRLEGEQETLF